MMSTEEKDIVKNQKNKKREERRKRNRGEEQVGKKREQKGGVDEFDGMLEKYKSKLIRKLEEKKGTSGPEFEDVVVSD